MRTKILYIYTRIKFGDFMGNANNVTANNGIVSMAQDKTRTRDLNEKKYFVQKKLEGAAYEKYQTLLSIYNEARKSGNTSMIEKAKNQFRCYESVYSDISINRDIALGRWRDSVFTAGKFNMTAVLCR